jgi:XTP/dITP diphosphohydrolase
VLEKLVHVNEEDRTARFKAVISLFLKGKQYFFEGAIEGKIVTERRGKGGFGYDPIFVPDGYDRTFAEMTAEEKNGISHRGIAVQKLVSFLMGMETA